MCNGRWDCPGGVEENLCDTPSCPGLFRCFASSICIHTNAVCDDTTDCPNWDESHLCKFVLPACPAGCVCLSVTPITNAMDPIVSLSVICVMAYRIALMVKKKAIVLNFIVLVCFCVQWRDFNDRSLRVNVYI